MKRIILMSTVALLVGASFGFDGWPSGGGTVEIPSGETITVSTQEDLDLVNACTLVFPDRTATLVFETVNPFTAVVKGTGTIVKNTAASWTLTTEQADWLGDIVVKKGRITMSHGQCFGAWYTANGARLIIEGGATWDVSAGGADWGTGRLNAIQLRVEGTGDDGNGAIQQGVSVYNSYVASDVVLTGDTLIYNARNFLGFSFYQANNAAPKVNAVVDMGGHKLTVKATSQSFSFGTGTTIRNAGDLELNAKTTSLADSTFVESPDIREMTLGANVTLTVTGCKRLPYNLTLGSGAGISDTEIVWPSDEAAINTNAFAFAGQLKSSLAYAPYVAGGASSAIGQGFGRIFLGGIAGAATLSATTGGKIVFGNGGKTTGAVSCSGLHGASLYAFGPDFVSDLSQVTVGRTHLTVTAPGPASGWTWAKIWELVAKGQNFTDGAAVAIDTSYLDGQNLELTPTDSQLNSTTAALGKDGKGVLEVKGTLTREPRFTCVDGTLKLTGDIYAGDILASGVGAYQSGTVEISGGARIVTKNRIGAGTFKTPTGWYDANLFPAAVATDGKLDIKDATVTTDLSLPFKDQTWNGLCAGVDTLSPGTIEICDGAVVTGRLELVRGSAAYQSGGHLVAWGNTADNENNGRMNMIGRDSSANFCLSGGIADFVGYTYVASYGRNAQATVNISGGSFRIRAHQASPDGKGLFGARYGSLVHFDQTGGETDMGGSFYLAAGYANNGQRALGIWSMEGGTALFSSAYLSMDSAGDAIFNLEGGVVAAPRLSPRGDAGHRGDAFVCINLNGGTFRLTGSTAIFGTSDPAEGGDRPNHVTIGEKGAVIDLNGKWDNVCYASLEGVTGNGIARSDVPEGAENETFRIQPFVKIEGDGYGATAVATWDRATKKVTGIRIVDPGTHYTEAKVILRSNAKAWTNDLAGADFADLTGKDGGLKVKGTSGSLKLSARNSFSGPLTVEDGATVVADVAGAVPDGVALLLNGGTLDLTTNRVAFASVGGTGGKVMNGSADIVGEWKVSAQQFVDRVTTAVDGTIDLTRCTAIVLTDTDCLATPEAQAMRGLNLVTADPIVLPQDGLEIKGVPDGWKLKVDGHRVRLARQTGTVLFVR